MIIHINCGFKLINGLQIEKVCPTFLNFAKNNHNQHKVAKFGWVWSHRVLLCGEILSKWRVLGSLFDWKGLEICLRWLWPRFLWKESWREVNRSGGALWGLGTRRVTISQAREWDSLCQSHTNWESELPQIHLFLKAKEFVISIVCQGKRVCHFYPALDIWTHPLNTWIFTQYRANLFSIFRNLAKLCPKSKDQQTIPKLVATPVPDNKSSPLNWTAFRGDVVHTPQSYPTQTQTQSNPKK